MQKHTDDSSLEQLMPGDGQRALIVGSTGSGKTLFAAWLLRRLPVCPLLIFDTKIEKKFENLPKCLVIEDWDGIETALNDVRYDYVVYRPSVDVAHEPAVLDAQLLDFYDSFPGVPVYLDEIYSFHSSGRAGKGLTALLTRGRSRGITTIMATQRPAWLSRFVLSETQVFYVFALTLHDDKRKMADAIPDFDELPPPPKHGFYYHRAGTADVEVFAPVKPDKGMDTGYTEVHNAAPQDAAGTVVLTDRHHWI
jgi:DNA helicase HerA-like ATPase